MFVLQKLKILLFSHCLDVRGLYRERERERERRWEKQLFEKGLSVKMSLLLSYITTVISLNIFMLDYRVWFPAVKMCFLFAIASRPTFGPSLLSNG